MRGHKKWFTNYIFIDSFLPPEDAIVSFEPSVFSLPRGDSILSK